MSSCSAPCRARGVTARKGLPVSSRPTTAPGRRRGPRRRLVPGIQPAGDFYSNEFRGVHNSMLHLPSPRSMAFPKKYSGEISGLALAPGPPGEILTEGPRFSKAGLTARGTQTAPRSPARFRASSNFSGSLRRARQRETVWCSRPRSDNCCRSVRFFGRPRRCRSASSHHSTKRRCSPSLASMAS